jgi:hypothetical protein
VTILAMLYVVLYVLFVGLLGVGFYLSISLRVSVLQSRCVSLHFGYAGRVGSTCLGMLGLLSMLRFVSRSLGSCFLSYLRIGSLRSDVPS